jgi:hypothetical protein
MCRNSLDVIWAQSTVEVRKFERCFNMPLQSEQAMFRFRLHAVDHPDLPGVFYMVDVISTCGLVFKLCLLCVRGILIG